MARRCSSQEIVRLQTPHSKKLIGPAHHGLQMIRCSAMPPARLPPVHKLYILGASFSDLDSPQSMSAGKLSLAERTRILFKHPHDHGTPTAASNFSLHTSKAFSATDSDSIQRAEPLVGWHDGSDHRGTWQIIVNCLTTIVACTWSIQHLNVPLPHEKVIRRRLRPLKWMLIAVFAPRSSWFMSYSNSFWPSK